LQVRVGFTGGAGLGMGNRTTTMDRDGIRGGKYERVKEMR